MGEHDYKYIVDGRWCYDPEVLTRIDREGNINNVVKADLSVL